VSDGADPAILILGRGVYAASTSESADRLEHLKTVGTRVSGDPITETIARDAAESDVLVIATTALDRREPSLSTWLNSLALADGDRQCPGLLIGLFGDEKDRAAELNWMVGELVAFTRRTRMDFAWRWMDSEALGDSSWLTAVLEESCARRPSVINYRLANSMWWICVALVRIGRSSMGHRRGFRRPSYLQWDSPGLGIHAAVLNQEPRTN
jgi:hypothetical protein